MKIRFAIVAAYFIFPLTISANVLPVQQKYIDPGKINWSWAAASQAVLEYFGVSLSQNEIADYGTNGLDLPNFLYGKPVPEQNYVDDIMLQFANLRSQGQNTPMKPEYITKLINHFRVPVFIRWVRDESFKQSPIEAGGRVLLIKGVRYEGTVLYLMLMDPVDGTYEKEYGWVVEGKGHKWMESLEIVTRPSTIDKYLPVENKSIPDATVWSLPKKNSFTGLGDIDWDGVRGLK